MKRINEWEEIPLPLLKWALGLALVVAILKTCTP